MVLKKIFRMGAALLCLCMLAAPAVFAEDIWDEFASDVLEKRQEILDQIEENEKKMEESRQEAAEQQEEYASRFQQAQKTIQKGKQLQSVIFIVFAVIVVVGIGAKVFLLRRAYQKNRIASQRFQGFPSPGEGNPRDQAAPPPPEDDDNGFAPPPSR